MARGGRSAESVWSDSSSIFALDPPVVACHEWNNCNLGPQRTTRIDSRADDLRPRIGGCYNNGPEASFVGSAMNHGIMSTV